jgi:hypothetical protein
VRRPSARRARLAEPPQPRAEREPPDSGSREDPFGGVSDGEPVAAGRTACLRATDLDMSFDGMLDLLGTSPHQAYAILAEASDELCPSHRDTLDAIMDG